MTSESGTFDADSRVLTSLAGERSIGYFEAPMSAVCLNFDDLLEINKPQVAEFQRLAELLPTSETPAATAPFSRQVRIVEGMLIQTYGIASKLTRETDDLTEVAGIWKNLASFCNSVLQALASLRERFPSCGTPELYDLALDYKVACDKRHRGVLQELSCQTIELPKGLLPELS
jgi:hypothetical protein